MLPTPDMRTRFIMDMRRSTTDCKACDMPRAMSAAERCDEPEWLLCSEECDRLVSRLAISSNDGFFPGPFLGDCGACGFFEALPPIIKCSKEVRRGAAALGAFTPSGSAPTVGWDSTRSRRDLSSSSSTLDMAAKQWAAVTRLANGGCGDHQEAGLRRWERGTSAQGEAEGLRSCARSTQLGEKAPRRTERRRTCGYAIVRV
jgi:hypothetical protein